jgi:hypothetical protein
MHLTAVGRIATLPNLVQAKQFQDAKKGVDFRKFRRKNIKYPKTVSHGHSGKNLT